MVNIITACSRPDNLDSLYYSIQFDLVTKWYIVYDTSKERTYDKLYDEHPQIIELECSVEGVCGHPQINYALSFIKSGFVYVLDDDNIIHPQFWQILPTLDIHHIYTWDQIRYENKDTGAQKILKGGNIKSGYIDTAQFIVPREYIGNSKWPDNRRNGDYYFIIQIYKKYAELFIYVPRICAYWNCLQDSYYKTVLWNYYPNDISCIAHESARL